MEVAQIQEICFRTWSVVVFIRILASESVVGQRVMLVARLQITIQACWKVCHLEFLDFD